jgi:F0F1-type ATP synthase membrane subunit b/b'
MNSLSTTTISAIDLINFSQSIAQLNLGYLGISVAILGVLGGVFVYFNIKPLRDTLEKQERVIEELKKEAQNLLVLSAEQSKKSLEDFKVEQSKSLVADMERQEEKLKIETINKIQEVEKKLSEEIESKSEEKDIKLREIILSEANNRAANLEKEITASITAVKESMAKEVSEAGSVTFKLKASIKELDKNIKELQIYKYSKEGQRGAVIVSIELLTSAIDEYFDNKELYKGGTMPFAPSIYGWEIVRYLKGLVKEIGDITLEQEYISQINTQLTRIADENYFLDFIRQLKEKLEPAH